MNRYRNPQEQLYRPAHVRAVEFLCPDTCAAHRTGLAPALSEHSGYAPTPGGSAAPRTLPAGKAELQQSPRPDAKPGREQGDAGAAPAGAAAHPAGNGRHVEPGGTVQPPAAGQDGTGTLLRFSLRTRTGGKARPKRGSAGGSCLASPLPERSAPWEGADPPPLTEPRTPEQRRAAGGDAATFTAGGPAALPARSIPYRRKKAQSRALRPSRNSVPHPTCLAPGDSSPPALLRSSPPRALPRRPGGVSSALPTGGAPPAAGTSPAGRRREKGSGAGHGAPLRASRYTQPRRRTCAARDTAP